MKYLPILGFTVALVSVADIAVAKTPAEIESIAKAVTAEITLLKAESVGSGIIIERKGDRYTLVTNRHVVCGKIRKCNAPPSEETYTVKLGDGQKYQVSAKSVKLLGNDLDLAIVQFQSNRAYPVAQIDDAGNLNVGAAVYTSGYPATPPGFSFNAGKAIAVVNKRLTEDRGGYTVIYNAHTQPGMSGGGVFNQEGRLVAIHGQGERFRDNTELEAVSSTGTFNAKQEVGSKFGLNRGIPVRWVVRSLAERGIGLGNRQQVKLGQIAASSADEHFIAGFNKFMEPGANVLAGKRLAVSEFIQAIRINPSYTLAYYMRAVTYSQLQEGRRALADFDRAIALNPKFAEVYYSRGVLKEQQLNNPQGALTDYDRAIALNPKYTYAYNNRGNLKADKLNDYQGALADFDLVIALDPKLLLAYYNRGNLKQVNLNDTQGALADYAQAIVLNPKFAQVYGARGYMKYTKLKDRSGGIVDVRQAAKLARAQRNSGYLQSVLELLQSWGVGE